MRSCNGDRACRSGDQFLILLGLIVVVLISVGCADVNAEPASGVHPPAPEPVPNEESWLVLPKLPSNATQADIGAEIYRLVCQDCHGDRGQGLTDEWRAQWAPEDQNCWTSKCHASNYPPEGFALPRFVPAIMGSESLARFETTLDLLDYIKSNMPWHDPGNLVDAEYRQLTSFLARERGLDDAVINQPLH